MASLAPVARLGATLEPTGMARLACLAPTRPGVLCGNETSGRSPCFKDEVCCPLTSLCVKPSVSCTPE